MNCSVRFRLLLPICPAEPDRPIPNLYSKYLNS